MFVIEWHTVACSILNRKSKYNQKFSIKKYWKSAETKTGLKVP